MNVCSLDTNCLLSLLVPGRDSAKQAVLQELKEKECHVSDLVIVEAEFVLAKVYELPRSLVADNIQAILNIESINCNRNLFRAVLPEYVSHPSLSFVDICIAIQAKLNNATPLFTSDRKLANQMDVAELLTLTQG